MAHDVVRSENGEWLFADDFGFVNWDWVKAIQIDETDGEQWELTAITLQDDAYILFRGTQRECRNRLWKLWGQVAS